MDKLYAAVADVHSSFDSNGLHDFLATPKTLESLALVGSFKWGLDFSDEEISTRIGPALREIVNSQRNARLHNLIIDGEPQFLDFGHHDCVRKEEKVLDVEINGDYLCGLPSLGSSSHLLSPSVPVRVIERSISRSNNDLPTLLIYEEGKAKEAKYDFQSAAFVAVEDGKQFDLEELYVSMPQMFRSYIKNRRSTKIPKNRRSKNLLKQISQDIVYANTRLNDFTQQVIDHFTFGRSLLKTISSGNGSQSFITNEQVADYSYASYNEIRGVIKVMSWSGMDHYVRKKHLNRFLLATALDRSPFSLVSEKNSVLVGQITGDAHTIHLPYVVVNK